MSNQNNSYTSNMIALQITEKTRLGYLTVNSNLTQEKGNQIAYEFSKKNNFRIIAIYHQGKFYIIVHAKTDTPTRKVWQKQLQDIANELQTKIGSLDLKIKELGKINNPEAIVIAKLASTILNRQVLRPSWQNIVDTEPQIIVYRYLKISPETFLNQAALILDWRTSFKYPGTVRNYWLNHQRNNDRLIGLIVRNRFVNSNNGTIDSIIGYCNETEKNKLLNYPNLRIGTKKAIKNSEESDIIVAVKTRRWGEDTYPNYVLNGLEIPINRENAKHLGVNYDSYQSQTKINLKEWLELLNKSNKNASDKLAEWEIKVEEEYVNSQNYSKNFYVSKFDQDSVKLLFGKNVIKSRSDIKNGLKDGGVYRRHQEFNNPSIPLQVVVLKLCKAKAKNFLTRLETQLENLKFPVTFIEKIPITIEGNMSEVDTAKIEEKIKETIGGLRPDLVITILPKNDKKLDHTDRGSYYYHISHQLIPQRIASQMISEENLNNGYIINNVVLGILAKLGNLPFIFSEPLKVANYFIGLDVARERKTKTGGTINACACVRIYGASGDFIRYKLANGNIEGEEISIPILRQLLPFEELSEKTVLILRDGRFRGQEIPFLKERAEAIKAKLIFVEITKKGACRLFNQYKEDETIKLQQPHQYLIFKHSDKQVTIVTTKPLAGLSQPIRITIREEGIIPALDDVIEAVIKLCLLHHGSYKEAGIPMPIFASDKIGYKSLKGLSHVQGTGERQWWH